MLQYGADRYIVPLWVPENFLLWFGVPNSLREKTKIQTVKKSYFADVIRKY